MVKLNLKKIYGNAQKAAADAHGNRERKVFEKAV
jgi:hypothetical protein